MKTYIRRQQHKNFKHQDIKQKEPPQKYRLGMIVRLQTVMNPAYKWFRVGVYLRRRII